MAEQDRSIAVALIGGSFLLAAAVVGGLFTLAARDGTTQAASTSTAPASPVASATNSSTNPPVSAVTPTGSGTPSGVGTPSPAAPTERTSPPSSGVGASAGPAVTGIPRRVAPGDTVVVRGSGFPPGQRVRAVYAVSPGVEFDLGAPLASVDADGAVTISFVVDSMFCGYQGAVLTYSFEEIQKLTTSPMSVAC